jgi:hypothetical protein
MEGLPQSKDSSGASRVETLRRELLESWTLDADFYGTAQDGNLLLQLIKRHTSLNEQPIISTTKSFDKKN